MPGNRNDAVGMAPLIKRPTFDAPLAPSHGLLANQCRTTDKAVDSTWIIDQMNQRGALIGRSLRPQRLAQLQIDQERCKCRHLIDLRRNDDPPDHFLLVFFCRLKTFRPIARRSKKTDTRFTAVIYARAAPMNAG